MWIAILALLYSLPPLAALAGGLRMLTQAVKTCRWDARAWSGLAVVCLILTGRWWVRLLRPVAEDEPKRLKPTRCGHIQGWGGVRLEWEQFGPDAAPAILLAHGWSLTHDTFYYQKLALAGEFRILVWDMRGMGRSALPADNDYSMNALLQDFAAVFDAAEAGRHLGGCLLAGHSLGAMLLPLFAEAFPERMTAVRGLALMAGTDSPLLASMRGRQWLVPSQKCFWEPLARLMGCCPWPFAAFARLIWQVGAVHLAAMYTLHRGRESRGQIDLIAFHCATVSMQAAGMGAISCFQFDARRAMTGITVPTLLMTGERDVNMPPEIQHAMAARLAHPELVLIKGCGHQNILECHAEVNDHLRDFARRCLGGEGGN